MKIPKNFVAVEKGVKTSKLRYRLLADGTILDQDTNKTAGYITSRIDLDTAWKMRGNALQKYLREFI